jgi:hypothetical protein
MIYTIGNAGKELEGREVRCIKRQFRVNRLFILGAGASFSSSQVGSSDSINRQAPLDMDFCERICSIDFQRPGWVSKSCSIVKDKWLDNKPLETCGLEEAVSRQLTNIDFLNAVHKQRRKGSITSFEYINHLSHLIVFILKKVHENNDFAYRTFVEKIFNKSFSKCKDRIITFNYDDLLDKHLLTKFEKEQVYFDTITNSSKRPPHRKAKREILCDFPLLIKLHGSVNWRCDETDFKRIISGEKGDPYIHIWKSETSTHPDDKVAPLIIPPLPAKPLSKIGIFRWLWTKAFEYLRQANEIIICGYSLPEIDEFARSLFSDFPNKRLKKLL